MKKEIVTKENYKELTLKRSIIVCWILLLVCFIVKIFGGNFFTIICNNQTFINICNYIQSSYLYYVISFITSIIGYYFLLSIMFDKNKFTKKEVLILYSTFVVCFIIQIIMYHFNLGQYVILTSIIKFVILPLLMKCSWQRVLIVNVLDLAFQIISMLIKNIALLKLDTNVLTALIFMIDYYIMLILCFLYNNEIKLRRENNMGMFGSWFLHKPLAELEALLPTLKDKKEIELCKKRIQELKKDEKNS